MSAPMVGSTPSPFTVEVASAIDAAQDCRRLGGGIMRASIRLGLLLVMLGAWGNPAIAAYPDRAIRIVVPFPPGGPVDLVARIVAPKLSERLGQKVDVDNVAGDDGILGTDLVAKAAPDGYTLLLASTVHTIH